MRYITFQACVSGASNARRADSEGCAHCGGVSDAVEAFAQIFSPPLRKVMWKSLFLTAAVLLALGVCLDRLAASIMPVGPASFYVDDVAATVERDFI